MRTYVCEHKRNVICYLIPSKLQKMKIFAILVFLMGSAAASFAQATASANATAAIVTAISITKVVDMNFGNVAVQTATGGTVVLTPASTRTSTGGVTLPSTTGTVTAASFNVGGEGIYTYSITLPAAATTISNGANSMSVNTFTSTPSGAGSLAAGFQVLHVGATLNVAAAQPSGVYTSATPFNVTVNYN
jgi:hypothetical protein